LIRIGRLNERAAAAAVVVAAAWDGAGHNVVSMVTADKPFWEFGKGLQPPRLLLLLLLTATLSGLKWW
jgi:hypothetical protein